MKRALKIAGVILLAALVFAAAAGSWWVFLDGRAPAKRPDLVRMPESLPTAPSGYPTWNAVMLAFFLGRLDLIDVEKDQMVPPEVIAKKDVEYGRIGSRRLLLDLYSPAEAEGPRPGLLFIHGGGWTGGDKKIYALYTIAFAKRGYVAATVGYRLAGEAKFPACIEDVKCAIRWMRANAASLNVDPDRIAVIGGSAGGHLALLAGYSANDPALEGSGGHAGVSSAVGAVVNIYGVSDLRVPDARNRREVRNLLGGKCEEKPEACEQASPLAHLDANDPPTLTIHGTIDQVVPVSQADILAEALQKLGMPYWYDRIDGWPHTMDIVPVMNEYVQRVIAAFLEEQFGGPLPRKRTDSEPQPN